MVVALAGASSGDARQPGRPCEQRVRRHLRAGGEHPAQKAPPTPDHVEIGAGPEVHHHRVGEFLQVAGRSVQVAQPVRAHRVGGVQLHAHLRQILGAHLQRLDAEMPPQRQAVVLAQRRGPRWTAPRSAEPAYRPGSAGCAVAAPGRRAAARGWSAAARCASGSETASASPSTVLVLPMSTASSGKRGASGGMRQDRAGVWRSGEVGSGNGPGAPGVPKDASLNRPANGCHPFLTADR